MPPPGSLHRLAEERSLELHRAVAERLREQPALLERARERVAGWIADGSVSTHYATTWAEVLSGSVEEVCTFLAREDEEARALRQVTPFSGVVDPRTRWRIWREVRQRMPAR